METLIINTTLELLQEYDEKQREAELLQDLLLESQGIA